MEMSTLPSGLANLSQSVMHSPGRTPISRGTRDPMMMSMDKLFSEGEVIDTRTSIAAKKSTKCSTIEEVSEKNIILSC